MQPIIAAISIGLGIGLMAGHIKWEEVKQRTEDLASVAGSIVALVGGAGLALNSQSVPITPAGAKKEDESGAEEGAKE
jgi:CHASE2 domain-containing sensor protein